MNGTLSFLFPDSDDGSANEGHIMYVKAILVGPMFLVSLISAILPVFLVRCYRNAETVEAKIRYAGIVSLASTFVCGTFLGLAFLDMLPDIVLTKKIKNAIFSFELGHFAVVIGLLFMIILDQILLVFTEHQVDAADPVIRTCRPVDICRTVSTDKIYTHTLLHSLILWLSLASHSVFEGMVIGCQSKNEEKVLRVFIPVLLHKVVVAFGVGLNVALNNISRVVFVFLMFLFAVMSPMGIIFGNLLESVLSENILLWIELLLQGFACGTFIYVVCFKILTPELQFGRFRLMKMLMLVIGFGSMTAFIMFWHDHDHDHQKIGD